jgi:hypothetical protein
MRVRLVGWWVRERRCGDRGGRRAAACVGLGGVGVMAGGLVEEGRERYSNQWFHGRISETPLLGKG